MKKGSVVSNELVLNLDLAPTLLEFAGVPVPAEMQGRSLLLYVNAGVDAVELSLPDRTWGDGWEVVLAGDVSYERDMAARVTDWLDALRRRGASVLIGDPGRSYLARDRLEPLAEYRVPVTRSLEDAEIKVSQVWRFR
jgi:predicted nicotinamide N-methyase